VSRVPDGLAPSSHVSASPPPRVFPPGSSLRPIRPFDTPKPKCLLFVITNEIKYNPRAFIQHSALR